MAYLINNIQASRKSDSGNDVACTEQIYDRNSQPAPDTLNTSIATRHVMVIEVTATDGDTFDDKTLLFTPRMYAPPGVVQLPTNTVGFTADTSTPPSVLTPASWTGTRPAIGNDVLAFAFPNNTTLQIIWEFNTTSDLPDWPFFTTTAAERRFMSTLHAGQYMTEDGATAFNDTSLLSELQYVLRVKDFGAPDSTFQYATWQNVAGTENRVGRVPIRPTWYGRNEGSTDWQWFTQRFIAAVGGQSIAEKLFNGDPYDTNYDNNFTEDGAQLSPFDDNTITFLVDGTAAPANIEYAQVFLFREETIPNTTVGTPYLDQIEFYEAGLFDAATTTSAIYPFSGAVNFIPSPSSGVLQFTLNGNVLEYGKKYRVGAIFHDATNCRSYSVISHSLNADRLPQCLPAVESFLGNYCGEAAAWYGLFSKNELFSTRLNVDLNPFFDCFADAGLMLDLSNLFNITFDVLDINTANTTDETTAPYTTVAGWFYDETAGTFSDLLSPRSEQTTITEAGNIIDAALTYRISEGWETGPGAPFLGGFVPLKWTFRFDVQAPDGSFERVDLVIYQRVAVKPWENDEAVPDLDIQIYNGDVWPTRQGVLSLCNTEKLIIEVTKLNECAGVDVLLQTTYNLARAPREFISNKSHHHGNDPGITSIIQKFTDAPQYDVTPFSGDTATFCIDTDDLPLNVETFVDAVICKESLPDCCPVLGDVLNNYWRRRAGQFSFVYLLPTNLFSAVNGAAVGNVNVITHEIINDQLGGTTDITFFSNTDTLIYARVNHLGGTTSLTWIYEITAEFDCDGTTKLIRHRMEAAVILPTGNQGWLLDQTRPAAITCTDLGAV